MLDDANTQKTQAMMEKLGDKVDKAIMSALDAEEISQLFLPQESREENNKTV